ncbi:MAG TPA: PadR family transcriptional regulator [Trebonia sp.]|nr:PadR family transcriptional regulator [Trebonia sp.]
MHEEHRRGMRDEGWGPPPRPGRPEWEPRPGRGPGGRGGERGERGERGDWGGRGERGPGWGGRGRWGWAEAGPFPPMGPMFGRHPFGRGPRARRGDVRAAILDLLAEGNAWNGYQIIQEIAGRTEGIWRPSAGSVYPALQQLEDEGLIRPEGEGRRRLYTLTDEGRAYAEAHAEELRRSWDAVAGMTDDAALELGDMIRQVMMAVMEVRRAGSASQLAEARRVLAETRRSMYRILAEDAATASEAGDAAEAGDEAAPEDAE